MAFGVEIEDVAATSVLDLVGLNSDDNLRVDQDWVPQPYDGSGKPITERIPMLAIGTNAEIKAALDDLDQKLEKATLWNADKSRRDWIRLNILEQAASQEVYRTILGGKIIPATLIGSDTFLDKEAGDNRYRFDLELETLSHFESAQVNSTISNVDRFAGTGNLTNSVGSRPARISRVDVPVNVVLLGDMWLGIRDEREGLTDFAPQQEFQDGALGSGSSLVSGGAPEYATNYVETDFVGTPEMASRLAWVLQDSGASNLDHFNGKYLIIARVRLDLVGAKAGLQLRWGFGAGSEVENPAVELTCENASDWKVLPLGYIQIPPWPAAYSDPIIGMDDFKMDFWAEELDDNGGSPELQMDVFCFMPTDHLFTMLVPNITGSGVPNGLQILTREDWFQFAYGTDINGTKIKTGLVQSFQNWTLPTGNSRAVLVSQNLAGGQRDSPSPASADMSFTFYRHPVLGFPFEV